MLAADPRRLAVLLNETFNILNDKPISEILSFFSFIDWVGVGYFAAGVVLGATLSVVYSIKAKRPRIVINGGGSGGNQSSYSWNIGLSNLPRFLGHPLEGETAREVRAFIRLDEPKAIVMRCRFRGGRVVGSKSNQESARTSKYSIGKEAMILPYSRFER